MQRNDLDEDKTMEMKVKENQAAITGVTALVSLAIVLVVYAIVTSFGAQVVGDINSDFTANSYEDNISTKALEGMDVTADKLPTVARITVAAIIISIILAAFGGFVALRG